MTTYVSNCGFDLGEMNDVNGWGQECCSNPYKAGSNFGMEHCDFNDVDYVGYELHPPDMPTGDSWPPNLSAYYGQDQSSTYVINEPLWGSSRLSPQASICQGMNSNRDSYFEHWYDDNSDVNHDYWVPEIAAGNIEHEIDFRDVAPNEGVKIAAGNVFDTCFESDFGHSPSMHNTAAPTGFHAKLDLCVKRHELCVKEHELWVQERAIIRKDLDSLRSRLDRLIEEEKCKELEATQQCVEKHKLGDDAVFMDDQGLEEDDIKLIDNAGCIINQESKQNENIMEVEGSQGNEGKMEPSIGLKAAMRCLELQRKFWDIGSFFSVIPAIPIHHFDDPFLLGAKGVHGVPSAYEASCFGEVYSSGLSYFLSSLGAANKGTSKHSFLPYGNELPVTLRRLLMVSWKHHLQSEWIDTIPSTGHALWRPPDTRVRVNDSFVHLLAILIAWGTIWRSPDMRVTVYDCLYHLLIWAGFWFSCWRPPDGVGALGFSFCPPCSFEVEAFQSGMD